MFELQQRFLDNLVSDIPLSIFLLVISVSGLYRLAKFWKVSVLPFLVLLPSFLVAGLILHVPLSPLYVRSDGEYYQSWGYSLAAAWLAGEPMVLQALWPGKGLWPSMIAGFSVIAGPVTITLIVFNTLILALTAILLQKATFLFGGRSPRWSMVIVYLSSGPFFLWGPSLMREALFWLGVALAVLALSYASVDRHRSVLLSFGLSALVLLGVRPDAGLVLVYGFVVMLIFLFGIVGHRRSLLRAAITSLVLFLLVLLFPSAFEFARGAEVTGQSIAVSADELAEANTAFSPPSDSDASSSESEFGKGTLWTTLMRSVLSNLPHAFFGPFHWEYGPSAIWFIAGTSTLHFLVLVGLAAYSVLISKGQRWPLLAVLAVAGVSMLMFSSILTNYGILIRFRAATEIMLIPLALDGALELLARWRVARGKATSSPYPRV